MLQFSSFDVKSGPSCDVTRCQCSHVQITTHQKGPRWFNKKFCEGHKPNGVISLTSNIAQVRFKSTSFTGGNTFALKYWFERKPRKNDSPYSPYSPREHMTSYKVRRAAPSNSSSSGVVVTHKEDKEKAKEEEEEADPPDAIVLGPSIPIILIFIGVVASIAWWQFRSDQKERLRYYKEQIRYSFYLIVLSLQSSPLVLDYTSQKTTLNIRFLYTHRAFLGFLCILIEAIFGSRPVYFKKMNSSRPCTKQLKTIDTQVD